MLGMDFKNNDRGRQALPSPAASDGDTADHHRHLVRAVTSTLRKLHDPTRIFHLAIQEASFLAFSQSRATSKLISLMPKPAQDLLL